MKQTLLEDIQISSNWIANALNKSGYRADFSLESLKEIDRFFDEQSHSDGLLGTDTGNRIFALSSYVGNVLLTHKEGHWITDDADPKGELNIMIEFNDCSRITPVHKLVNRYKNGNEDSIYDYAIALTSK